MDGKKLLVVGELNVDLILNEIQGFPVIGEERIAEKLNLTLGSSSAIFASNIAVLGIQTAFCGMIGKDYFGDYIVSSLRDKNIDTQYIKRTENAQTGTTVVMNYEQDRANVTYCGAMGELTLEEVPWEFLHDFDHLHFSNYFLQKQMKKDILTLFKKAKGAGLSTSLDLQTDPDGLWDFDYVQCLPYVDIFLPNQAELCALTGEKSIDAGLKKLKPFANIIALKLGKKGGIVYQNGNFEHSQAYTHDSFKDAIGAGDSFNAGFIHHYLHGQELHDCLDFANLIGAINTTEAGGTGAFVDKKTLSQRAKEIFNMNILTDEA